MTFRYVPSRDGTLMYTFAEARGIIRWEGPDGKFRHWEEEDPHPFLMAIEDVSQPISSYGAYKVAVNTRGLDVPGVEYMENVRQNYVGKVPKDYVIKNL